MSKKLIIVVTELCLKCVTAVQRVVCERYTYLFGFNVETEGDLVKIGAAIFDLLNLDNSTFRKLL